MAAIKRLKITQIGLCCLLVAFCACSSGNAQPGDAVGTIMIVSERAYRSGSRMQTAECTAENLSNASNLDWNDVIAGMGSTLLDAINRGEVDGDSFDWDTAHGVADTLVGDALGFINNNEIFLVYSVTFDADSGVAIVTVGVHKGNPYDPNSEAVLTVSGTAIIGEQGELNPGDSSQIFSPCSAIFFAARDAIAQLIAMDFVDAATGGTS